MRSQPQSERLRIPRLHEDSPWSRELADQTLAGAEAGDNATRGCSFEHVIAVPGHQMSVVYDVLLSWLELGEY